MKKNFIYSHIRKICLYSSAISLFALIIIYIIFVRIPFSEVFSPTSMSYATSASTVYNSGVEYVEVTLNNAKYTGYDCIRLGKDGESTFVALQYYYAVTILREFADYKMEAFQRSEEPLTV